MYNHNKAQQSSYHVHISWDILYAQPQNESLIIERIKDQLQS